LTGIKEQPIYPNGIQPAHASSGTFSNRFRAGLLPRGLPRKEVARAHGGVAKAMVYPERGAIWDTMQS
jgi:hypothetical protein